MRIESIKLTNFRQMRNVELRFDKVDNKKDLHIILAMNGVGKTNVLNAITWCLYNSETHLQNKNLALPILNTAVADELRKIGGGNADMCVEIAFVAEDGKKKIIFKRTANFIISPSDNIQTDDKFSIKVMENNEWENIVNDDEQIEILSKYIPETINNYIFFDGEQLEKFFSVSLMENVKKGINELTQASYLEKASMSINDYLKNQLNPLLANGSDSEVRTQQIELDRIQGLIDECNAHIEKHIEQIGICEDEIGKAISIIRGQEAVKDKVAEMQELESERDGIINELDERMKELFLLAQKFYRKVGLIGSIKSYHEFIQKQENEGKLPPRIDRSIIEKIIATGHCPICNNDNPDISFVKELEKSLDIASVTASVLNKSIGALSNYETEVKACVSEREQLLRRINVIKNKIKEYDKKINEIDTYLRNFPNKDEISSAIDIRDSFKKQRDQHIEDKGAEKKQLEKLNGMYKEAEAKLQKLLEKNQELELIRRKIEFCKACRRIIDETRNEILTGCRNEMQSETFRIFNNLLWKERSFSKVEIGEDYSLRLFDIYGNQGLGSCSAAETALLALSFTLALQDISKHDSLLFIDTPIGRVDPENRENFIRTLLNVAQGKQVILTFTPSEYDANIKAIITNEFSTLNHLVSKEGLTELNAN